MIEMLITRYVKMFYLKAPKNANFWKKSQNLQFPYVGRTNLEVEKLRYYNWLFTLFLLFILHSFPLFQPYWDLSILSLAFYILLSIFMFILGKKTAGNKNVNDFSQVVFGSIIGKMLLTVVLVVVYFKLKQPDNQHFLLPFFLIYLVFTAFETSFMMKLSKLKR